ncbi:hypothetical protein BLNAU_21457 [Blattamonas nauphoetae]|uniref:Uncharacterized protein n=1 Tax=Blattamonas nauphoetae TaxID=2049346 RepID=A0ABQ9WVU9_9EUKA|nr:hypothetical protein BLNAU_21457 [Blattamonas nauphoetae]
MNNPLHRQRNKRIQTLSISHHESHRLNNLLQSSFHSLQTPHILLLFWHRHLRNQPSSLSSVSLHYLPSVSNLPRSPLPLSTHYRLCKLLRRSKIPVGADGSKITKIHQSKPSDGGDQVHDLKRAEEDEGVCVCR